MVELAVSGAPATSVEKKIGSRWKDPKRHLWLYGLAVPLSPFIAWLLVHYLHFGLFWATGAIITVKALHELERTGGKTALITMCIGGGQGIALAIERA